MEVSSFLIIVVDQLTFSDQKLITRIKANNKDKQIIIIHNFSKIGDKKLVKKYIQKDIIDSFPTAEFKYNIIDENDFKKSTSENQRYYVESESNVKHVIFAQDGTDAGLYFNRTTIQFIRECVNQGNQVKFDVKKRFLQFMGENFKEFFNTDIKNHENLLGYVKGDKEKSKFTINVEKLPELKVCMTDELGISRFFGKKYMPKSHCYKDGKQIIFEIEVPNYQRKSANLEYGYESGEVHLTVSGKKMREKLESTDYVEIQDDREEGEFNVVFSFRLHDNEIEGHFDKPKFMEYTALGVIRFGFDLKQKKLPIISLDC